MDNDYLMHEGVAHDEDPPGRGSGRYGWGTGEIPFQHGSAQNFLERVRNLQARKFEFTDEYGNHYTGYTAIAKAFGMSTGDFRNELKVRVNEDKEIKRAKIQQGLEQGLSFTKACEAIGINESTGRSLFKEASIRNQRAGKETANMLRDMLKEHRMVDIGPGIAESLGISKGKLDEAVKILQEEGYKKYVAGIVITKGKRQTNVSAICQKDVKNSELYNYEDIYNVAVDKVSHDRGDSFDPKFVYPKSLDSKRLGVVYAEDGGKEQDGLMMIRRGVKDLSLGDSVYAQVRILVDKTHYLKGMACYGDDEIFPEGKDILFYTNKHKGTAVKGPTSTKSVLKPIENDPDNPFGSLIKEGIIDPTDPTKTSGGQSYYIDDKGKKQLSLINKRAEAGDWGEWSDKLPAQFLSKQSKKLINTQLNESIKDKQIEYDAIMAVPNPSVRKKLLLSFADDCDATSINLKACSLPQQKYQVLIPEPTLKDYEIYAPNYTNGDTVALIRYPHAGPFEIVIGTVNNKNKAAAKKLGIGEGTNSSVNKVDAVCVNAKMAGILSGADFDGDTVQVIPCNSDHSKVQIISKQPLEGLKDFDPKAVYGRQEGDTFPRMKKNAIQGQMGSITNLINDMNIKNADENEMARAVRHSMVIIDAYKHDLNYQLSAEVEGIKELKKKYQYHIGLNGRPSTGASTLISRAKSQQSVPRRQGNPKIAEDGSLVYKTTTDLYYEESKKIKAKDERGRIIRDAEGKETYVLNPDTGKPMWRKTGKIKMRQQQSTQMAEVKDARELSTGTDVEELYAKYANSLKAMANTARREYINTKDFTYNPAAAKVYAPEVSAMKAALTLAKANAPLERRAQAIASSTVDAKKKIEPDLSEEQIRKIRQQALTKARANVGAKRNPIKLTDRDVEAIQAGAINKTTLESILKYTDIDALRQKVMPREQRGLTKAQLNRIPNLIKSGYTPEQIASRLGISVPTLKKIIAENDFGKEANK